jgi:glutamate N-acetyltransferase/amino-acid N-acetyltransferase
MTFQSICAVEGVTANGIKEGKFGLALIRASGTAAGVFTGNLVRAAPIELMRQRIKKGKLEAVIVNRGAPMHIPGRGEMQMR